MSQQEFLARCKTSNEIIQRIPTKFPERLLNPGIGRARSDRHLMPNLRAKELRQPHHSPLKSRLVIEPHSRGSPALPLKTAPELNSMQLKRDP